MDRTAAVHEPTTPRRPIITALLLTLVAAVLPALLGVGPAAGADPTLTHVGAASSAGNRTAHVVRLPADVQAGDRLLLTLTTNDSTVAVSDPAGWTLLESRDGNGIRGRTWTRAAADADAGVNVTVTTAAATKSVLAVAAYRSSLGSTSVIASSSRVVNSAGTTHATAPVDVTDPGSWVVESWAEKSSSATAWSLPTGAVERTAAAFGGSGKISAVLADTGGAAAVGTHTAREATTDPAASRTVMTSVTTLLALISLFVLGGDVIRGFVFAMIWGVIVGTYSSVFIASAVLLKLGVKRDWSKPSNTAGNQFADIDA